MWKTKKNSTTIVKMISKTENILTRKRAEVIFDDGDKSVLLFLLENEMNCGINGELNNADVVIENYQLSQIEDGLLNLVFADDGVVTSGIIDLCSHTIELTSVTVDDSKNNCYEFNKRTGSFYLVTESNQIDESIITNEQKAVDFWLRFFNLHDETAIDDYLSEPYLQHNPKVADGVEAFRNEFIPRFLADMKDCSTIIKRVSSRNHLVYIHNILKRSPSVRGHAAVDIFRFENGKIVEHWDVIQPMPETSKNNHPMF